MRTMGIFFSCVFLSTMAYGEPSFRHFSIPQFMMDYYETDHTLWLVEYDMFMQLKSAADHEAAKNKKTLPSFVKRSTIVTDLAFGRWSVKYVPINPAELIALLPFLRWNGVECKTSSGMIELMGAGQIMQVGGVYGNQLYHYITEIIRHIEDQGYCVLKAA